MSNVKIYTATPADLSPPVQSESFCVDLVLASDYRELEAKCAALAAENAHARERHAFIRALAVSILEHSGGRMDWRGAMADATELLQTVDSVYAKTPATDAFLAEVRAQGVEMFAKNERIDSAAELIGGSVDISLKLKSSAIRAVEFAAQLRKGAAL
ncbi:hypothetical protein GVB90_001648 [Salmonella enterica]|nr:hypothetical protein [Salmonella enterica]